MNAEYRHPDQAIAAWLADGPVVANVQTRRAIAAAVRRTRQQGTVRPIDIARQSRLLAAAALLIALAALALSAGGLRLVVPVETPTPTATDGADSTPPPVSPVSVATLVRVERQIRFTYEMPEGLDIILVDEPNNVGRVAFNSARASGWPESAMATVEPGAHGVAVADVTGASEHGSAQPHPLFGATAAEFMSGLDASPYFVVNNLDTASIGGLPVLSGRVTPEGEWFTHIDIVNPTGKATSVEFGTPNMIFVSDVGEAVVLVEIWADTPEAFADWLPRALPFVESIRFVPPGS
jgi:hypothetical protein